MSLLNAWISAREAIVAVDTVGVSKEGEQSTVSKLLPIPHLNAVLASRGQSAFKKLLYVRILNGCHRTFDEMLEAMPGHLKAIEHYVDESLTVDGFGIGNEVLVAGWSHHRQTMLGRAFEKRNDATEFAESEVVRHIAPWDGSISGLSLKSGAVEQLAAAQVRLIRRIAPNAHCGGDLIVCRITPTATTTTHRMAFQAQEMAA